MNGSLEVSVVVIARNEGDYLRSTVENLLATLPAASEILVVDDGSTDGCADFLADSPAGVRLLRGNGLGVARARNEGARQTSGKILFFADAHIVLPDHWFDPLAAALDKPDVAAVAPAIYDLNNSARSNGYGLFLRGPDLSAGWLHRQGDSPYAVPILPGCSLAMTREMFEQTGGFDDGLLSRGGVDNEFGVRLGLQGLELHVVPRVSVGHLFRKVSPFSVGWDTFLHNYLRMALLHFGEARRNRVFDALRHHARFEEAHGLARERIGGRFEELAPKRKIDDDEFFRRFQMDW